MAIKLNRVRARNHYEKGVIYYHMAKADTPGRKLALSSAREALSRNPRYEPARILLAKILLDNADRKAALEIMEEGLYIHKRQQPSQAFFHFGAKLAKEMNRPDLVADFQANIKP